MSDYNREYDQGRRGDTNAPRTNAFRQGETDRLNALQANTYHTSNTSAQEPTTPITPFSPSEAQTQRVAELITPWLIVAAFAGGGWWIVSAIVNSDAIQDARVSNSYALWGPLGALALGGFAGAGVMNPKKLLLLVVYSVVTAWTCSGILRDVVPTRSELFAPTLCLLLEMPLFAAAFTLRRHQQVPTKTWSPVAMAAITTFAWVALSLPAMTLILTGTSFGCCMLFGVGLSGVSQARGSPGRRIWPGWSIGLVVAFVAILIGISAR